MQKEGAYEWAGARRDGTTRIISICPGPLRPVDSPLKLAGCWNWPRTHWSG